MRAIAATIAALALASGLALADASAAPAQPGTWQKHEYNFAFMGFTSTYSCDGLADKLAVVAGFGCGSFWHSCLWFLDH